MRRRLGKRGRRRRIFFPFPLFATQDFKQEVSFILRAMDIATLFVGSKNFWRLRTNVDIHILEHLKFQCIEIICFHPVLHLEDRIYFPMVSIISLLNEAKIEETMREKREESTRRRDGKNTLELLHNIHRLMVVDFVLTRAVLAVESSNFKISVKDCIPCDPNPDLKPFEVPERQKLSK